MQLTRADLRGLLLAQQGLLGNRHPGGVTGAATWVRRHGFLMLDLDARAFVPGHDLVLFNRLAGYQAGDLEAALYGGPLIEHYLHVVGAMPASDYALIQDPQRAAAASQPGSIGADVLACLASEGPCTLRDLQAHLQRRERDAQRAVSETVRELYACGAILVRLREGSQAVYAPARLVAPDAQALPPEERLRALARRSLQILAPVTRATWSQVLNRIGARAGLGIAALKREKGRLMADLLASGEAVQVEVDAPGEHYVVPADWLAAASLSHPGYALPPRLFFLSPIDPVVWDGQRTRDLFGFDGRQQAFRPTVRERRFTMPTLPILYGQELVGRLEVQMGWANQRLFVHAIHLESGARPDESHFRAAFGEALRELAGWLGAHEIRPAGPLPPRLLPHT